jgi:hypothetical protein
MSLREVLFERIMNIRRAQRAAAARDATRAATAGAPAMPPPSAAPPSAAVASPAAPSKPALTGRAAAYAMGVFCGPTSGGTDINAEFRVDPTTANWRASLNRPPPDYGPPIDPSESNVVKLFAEQVRIAKEIKS